ncbi:MAG TPA: hypothetical protein VJN18_02820 [Polyangiaceae bacterium]|nr:hypothetical protein [Polyangiaceae bacterium]
MPQAEAAQLAPLFVELSGAGVHHVFELDSDERAFVVGSSRQADLRLDHPGVAAVEFHIERVADVACLVPAYRGRRLRVNGAPASGAVPLVGRALVALGTLELELKVLHHEDEANATNRSSSAPRPLPLDYAATIPTDTAPTAVAMKPFVPDPLANVPTQQIPVQRAPLGLGPQQTERLAPVRPQPLQFPQMTERLQPMFPQGRAAVPVEPQQTQRLTPMTAPPPSAGRVPALEIRAVGAASTRAEAPQAAGATLANQETTSFDVAAVAPPAPRNESIDPRTVVINATPQGPRQAGKAVSTKPPLGLNNLLTQVGALTKQRPVLAIGGAAIGAMILSFALVGATRVAEPKRAPVPPTSSASQPALSKPAASAPAVPPLPAPPAMVAVPLPADTKPPAKTTKGPHDPELASAVGHLAAGRISEASQAYSALAARPTGGEVYARTAALLSRRATSCASGSPTLCPEILK